MEDLIIAILQGIFAFTLEVLSYHNLMNENNPYLRELEQMEEARRKYEESEWRLNFLRTIEPQPPSDLNDQQILQWHQHLKAPLN